MKCKNITLLILFLITSALSAKEYKGSLVFKNLELTEENNIVSLAFDIELNKNTVSTMQSLFIFPKMKNGAQEITFPYIQVTGANRSKALKRSLALRKHETYIAPHIEVIVNSKTEEVIHYNVEIPYEEWMRDAKLSLHEEMLSCAEKRNYFTYELNAKISWEEYIPQVTYVQPEQTKKERKAEGHAYLDFRVGQAILLPDFRDNAEELEGINETIQYTSSDPDITITGIFIEGYASPEGNQAMNERLSNARALAVKDYIRGIADIREDLFRVTTAGEDWDGLKSYILESNIEQKNKILTIIDSDVELDRKEQQLKTLGAPYKAMYEQIFPELRRVEYRIDYTIREYSLMESGDLFDMNPYHLSSYELYLLAQQCERNSDEWDEILELTVSLYPEDMAANFNAAAVFLRRREFSLARRYLDKVKHLPEAESLLKEYNKAMNRRN